MRPSSISAGEHHTLALTPSGVFSFGRSTYGRLGRADADPGSDEPHHEPKRLGGFDGETVVAVAAGVAVSAAVTSSGSMFVWGYGDTAMLGKGDDDSDEVLPMRLKGTRNFPAKGGIAVSLGGQHAAWLAAAPGDIADAHGKGEKARRV